MCKSGLYFNLVHNNERYTQYKYFKKDDLVKLLKFCIINNYSFYEEILKKKNLYNLTMYDLLLRINNYMDENNKLKIITINNFIEYRKTNNDLEIFDNYIEYQKNLI